MKDVLNCIIVDDEPFARQGMELLINELSYLNLVGNFSNAIKAKEFIDQNQVDLLFLDIEMPGLSGLDFIRSIKAKPWVILCTAYPQFALDAFELDVIDYLVKPIAFDRFFKAVEKVREFHLLTQMNDSSLEEIEEDYVFIKSNRKLFKLFFQDIIYIKGLKDYVVVHTADEKYVTAMNIKTIHSKLPNKIFVRVNKSHLININKLTSVEYDSIFLGHQEFTLGNTYKEDFLKIHIGDKIIKR